LGDWLIGLIPVVLHKPHGIWIANRNGVYVVRHSVAPGRAADS
jgi:hypothetical protein